MSASVEAPPKSHTIFDPEACSQDKKKAIKMGGLECVDEELDPNATEILKRGNTISLQCDRRGKGTKCPHLAKLSLRLGTTVVEVDTINDTCLRNA